MENLPNILVGRRIVLVDDDPQVIGVFMPALKKVTQNNAWAVLYNGQDITQIRDEILAHTPDIVLMDYSLGSRDMHGDAIVRDMLQHGTEFKQPIMFIGFSMFEERHKEFKNAGAQAFVGKNVLDVHGTIRQIAHEVELLSIGEK